MNITSDQQKENDSNTHRSIKTLLLKNDTLLGLLLLCIILSFSTDYFLSISNFMNILQQVSVIGVIAIGMTFIITSAEIDLSVGSVVAFSGSIMGVLYAVYDLPIGIAILVALIGSLILGLVIGTISIKFVIPSFIVTLASMMTVRGLAFIITGGYPSPIDSNFARWIGQKSTLGIPH